MCWWWLLDGLHTSLSIPARTHNRAPDVIREAIALDCTTTTTTAAATTCSTTWATPGTLAQTDVGSQPVHCAADTERPATASAVHNGTRSRAGPVVGEPPADPYGFRWRAYVCVCVCVFYFFPTRPVINTHWYRTVREIPQSQLMRRPANAVQQLTDLPSGGGGRADNATAVERRTVRGGGNVAAGSGFKNAASKRKKTRQTRRKRRWRIDVVLDFPSPVFGTRIAADRLDVIINRIFFTTISRSVTHCWLYFNQLLLITLYQHNCV